MFALVLKNVRNSYCRNFFTGSQSPLSNIGSSFIFRALFWSICLLALSCSFHSMIQFWEIKPGEDERFYHLYNTFHLLFKMYNFPPVSLGTIFYFFLLVTEHFKFGCILAIVQFTLLNLQMRKENPREISGLSIIMQLISDRIGTRTPIFTFPVWLAFYFYRLLTNWPRQECESNSHSTWTKEKYEKKRNRKSFKSIEFHWAKGEDFEPCRGKRQRAER